MSGTILTSFAAERLTIEKISLDDWNSILALHGTRLNDVKAQIYVEKKDKYGPSSSIREVKVTLYILTANGSEVLMDHILSALRKLEVEFTFSPNAKFCIPVGEILHEIHPSMHVTYNAGEEEDTNKIVPIESHLNSDENSKEEKQG